MLSADRPSEPLGRDPHDGPLEPSGAGPGLELNGQLLDKYDTRRAQVSQPAALARYRRALRDTTASNHLELQATAAGATHPELILDESNLLPFDFLRTGDRLGRAVLKLLRGDGAAGTAFLVAPGILLTNHHVLPDAEVARGTKAYANYEVSPPADAGGRVAVVSLDPALLFVTNAELDFSFCAVRGLDFLGTVTLDRDSLSVLPSEFVNIIQHPRGRPKEIALQDNRVVKVDNLVVQYCCDTEPGSSGSPVFNNHWHLVAMHHASVVVEHGAGRRTDDAHGETRFLNEGIRLSAIAVWLETVAADTALGRPLAQRLRGIFQGVDPQIGFFGALGRQVPGRTAPEAVVECYHEATGALDAAYWDLGPLAETFGEHLDTVGWSLASMGIDLWCLGGLDAERLSALKDHVDGHFRLDMQFLSGPITPSGEKPLVIAVRRSLAVEVDWPDSTGRPLRARVRVPVCRRRAVNVQLVPLVRDARGVPRRGRIEAIVTAAADQPSGELVLLGNGLTPRTLHALAEARPNLRAALGPEGGVAVLPSPGSTLATVYVAPNLDLTIGAAQALAVVHDRHWPPALENLGGPRPIALRLTFEGRTRPKPARRVKRPPPGSREVPAEMMLEALPSPGE